MNKSHFFCTFTGLGISGLGFWLAAGGHSSWSLAVVGLLLLGLVTTEVLSSLRSTSLGKIQSLSAEH